MKKTKIYCIISEVCYLTLLCFAAFLAISIKISINAAKENGNSTEGGEAIGLAIGAALMTLILILLVVYIVIMIIPTILKLVQIFTGKRVLSIPCMIFDILFAVIQVILIMNSDLSSPANLVIMLIITALIPTSLVMNILSLKKTDDCCESSDGNFT